MVTGKRTHSDTGAPALRLGQEGEKESEVCVWGGLKGRACEIVNGGSGTDWQEQVQDLSAARWGCKHVAAPTLYVTVEATARRQHYLPAAVPCLCPETVVWSHIKELLVRTCTKVIVNSI